MTTCRDEDNLLNTLYKVLDRSEDAGLFAAAHKCLFFDTEILWCGNVYSGEQVSHDWERLSGLASMRRPQTAAGELIQILQAVNWLRTSLPWLSRAVESLRVLRGEAGQASRIESDDRRGSTEARTGRFVQQCSRPGGQRRRFVAPEGQVRGADVSRCFSQLLGEFLGTSLNG